MNFHYTIEVKMYAVLAVDLGNTEVKFGLVEDGHLCGVARLPTMRVRALRTGEELLNATPGLRELIASRPPVALGSVVSWAGAKIAARMTELGCRVLPFTSLDGFGLRIEYAHGEPGVDRVAACAEAFARSGGPLILVGAGTAVHTNTVSAEGVYLGGAIMPGLRLMAQALGAGTDQVPVIEPRQPKRIIGQSTPECVEIGIYHAWLGGTLRLVELTRAELGTDVHLWLTGGQSAWLQPFLPDAQVDPDLALLGLARAFIRRVQPPTA